MIAPLYPPRLTAAEMADALAGALAAGALASSPEAAVLIDLSRLDRMLAALKQAFPPGALHAVAVKANPLVEVLRRVRDAGCGAEAASMGELRLAMAAGFPPEMVVFDSPVKTPAELERALGLGVTLNANSLDELDRIAALRQRAAPVGEPPALRSRIGIRVNPETGKGSIEATSVAGSDSKFGVPLRGAREELRRALSAYPWLDGLHVHIGSQGMSLDQLTAGTGAVHDFFVEVGGADRIRRFDLGGGLPAPYRATDQTISFATYAEALRERCPGLFASGVSLATEFGRAIHAGCGWVAARVEYVLRQGRTTPTLLVHVGADMFVRRAYRPDVWHHDLSVCDATGRLRVGPPAPFHVGGPLCFAGDYLGRDVPLPADAREGDYLLIHDAGAYTFGMWSMYNSRAFPAVLGYDDGGRSFRVLRRRQAEEEIVRFWGAE